MSRVAAFPYYLVAREARNPRVRATSGLVRTLKAFNAFLLQLTTFCNLP